LSPLFFLGLPRMAFRLTVLGFWIGAMALFSFVVAPSAFAVLPSSDLAGNLVSRVLAVTEIIGIAVSVVLLIALFLSREPRSASRIAELFGYVVTLLVMIASHFYISPRLHDLRTGTPDRVLFDRLHQLSVASMSLCLIVALALVIMLLWNRRAHV
jgi:hypothetical protein